MTGRNQSLDLLRGAAILLVVLVHCAQAATSIVPGLNSFAIHFGELGVQLFFIVSGFLVAPGDIASLHRLLKKLLLERSLGARIGAAGRESARLRFAPERALPRLEEIYHGVGLAASGEYQPPMPGINLRKAA